MPTNQTFNDLLDELKQLHAGKNHDYSTGANPYSNFEFAAVLVAQFTDPVDQVFASLIGIKLARLGVLKGSGKSPKHESVSDTMKDLTNYCGIWTARELSKGVAFSTTDKVREGMSRTLDSYDRILATDYQKFEIPSQEPQAE